MVRYKKWIALGAVGEATTPPSGDEVAIGQVMRVLRFVSYGFEVWPLALAVVLVAIIYRGWLVPGVITAGDFPYFSPSLLRDGAPFPTLWDSTLTLGGYNIIGAPMFPLASIEGFMAYAHLDWAVIERVLWIIPAVLVPCLSTYRLSMLLFQRRTAALIAAVAVVTNSYAYLLYEGGQFGVAMGYGCMPLALWAFMRGQRRGAIKDAVPTGVVLAVQAFYDIRSTYMTLAVLLVCVSFYGADALARREAQGLRPLCRVSGLSHLCAASAVLTVLHAWWILPALVVRAPALPSNYSSTVGLRALSQAHIDNGLSLFHPFWFANDQRIAPINPLFFIVPLLIFPLLLRRRHDLMVLLLLVVALAAAFLTKGDNDPAGGVYDWLFIHAPGFSLFRDASKFYQPLAVAYALLLGLAAVEAESILRQGLRAAGTGRATTSFVIALMLLVAVFPAYPALTRQVRGAFVTNPVPADFAQFNTVIERQQEFFRVLWVPARPRFGAYSALHPAIDAGYIDACCIAAAPSTKRSWSWLGTPEAGRVLRQLSVRYVIVADDTRTSDYIGQPWDTGWMGAFPKGLFSTLRAYFPHMGEFTIGRLHVLADDAAYPLLFTAAIVPRMAAGQPCAIGTLCTAAMRLRDHVEVKPQRDLGVMQLAMVSQARYTARLHVTRQAYLVLQQAYDPNWLLYIEPDGEAPSWWTIWLRNPIATSRPVIANGYANAWLLPQKGAYRAVLVYWPQRLVLLGLLVTAAVLLLGCVFLIARRRFVEWLLHLSSFMRAPRGRALFATRRM